jgi:hypothetical protein
MKMNSVALLVSLSVLNLYPSTVIADDDVGEADDITEIVVNARRVANTRPAGT